MQLEEIEKHLKQQPYTKLVHAANGLQIAQEVLPLNQAYLGPIRQLILNEMHRRELKNLKKNFKLEDEMIVAVDVTATGYEWTCPACRRLNLDIGYEPAVECAKCFKVYRTNSPDHS